MHLKGNRLKQLTFEQSEVYLLLVNGSGVCCLHLFGHAMAVKIPGIAKKTRTESNQEARTKHF